MIQSGVFIVWVPVFEDRDQGARHVLGEKSVYNNIAFSPHLTVEFFIDEARILA
jgi:hypothetical protein